MTAEMVPDEVLAAFCGDPDLCTVTILGFGNINDTYLVRSVGKPFVLQRINGEVFPEPSRVIENFQIITDHLTCKKDSAGESLQIAVPVLTLKNRLFIKDSTGAFWRAQSYLPHKSSRVLTGGPDQAYRVGKVLARFHRLIADLDLQKFSDPLPGFHNLPRYLEDYDLEIQRVKTAVSEDFHFCMETIERYRQQAPTLVNAERAGILIRQPIHGDPKVDNFLFDAQGEVLGLLDLDTVAMGLVHFDLGDCLRSCCNRLGETGGETLPVTFDLNLCRAFLDGYFSGPEKLLNKKQRSFVFDGVLLICFELGIRFFTDYLRGNRYFKVQQADENLLRAVNQFRLAEDISSQEKTVRDMVIGAEN